jgi:hypothetical protein
MMYLVNPPKGPYAVCSSCLEEYLKVPGLIHLTEVSDDCTFTVCMWCGQHTNVVCLRDDA